MSILAAMMRHSERIGLFHYRVETEVWRYVLSYADKTVTLVALWADEQHATMFLLEDESPVLISVPLEKRRYYAASERFPAAQWGERLARDLLGVEALASRDDRPLVDHGCWPVTWPLAQDPIPVRGDAELPAEKNGMAPSCSPLPGLLGVSYDLAGGKLKKVDVEIAAGHRGVLSQLKGLTPTEALALIGRVSAAGFVAHPLAFVRAVEQAQAQKVPPRERDTRLILLEIERISLHLFDIGHVARAVGAELLATHCEHTREALAQTCAHNGVSRRLTDVIRSLNEGCAVPEIVPFAQEVIAAIVPSLSQLVGLNQVYASRLDGLAIVPTEMAWAYGIGGVIGRASGRYLDRRSLDVGMRLDALRSSGRHEGCALARNEQRLTEIRDSLTLIDRILASIGLEDEAQIYPVTGEGIGVAESARGDVWYWITLQHGKIESVHVRDPALPILTVLGEVLEGHTAEQIVPALCSFGLSPAGVAL